MSKTYNEALLQRVEEYLASSGLSQNKMAQAVGLSQTALSNWRRKIYNGSHAAGDTLTVDADAEGKLVLR